MMAVEIVTVNQYDEFGARIPAPSEAFKNEVIHPRNLALQERQQNARLLSRKELITNTREASRLEAELEAAGWYKLKALYKNLKQKYDTCIIRMEGCAEIERQSIQEEISIILLRANEIRHELEAIAPLAARHHALVETLRDHRLALQRHKLHVELTKELAQEAYYFADLLVETWSRLGFKHETLYRNKRYVHKVEFDRVEVTPDAIWFKIYVSKKTMFGFKNVLPQGVKVQDLIDEPVLKELSYACQRQVTAKGSYTSGVWVKVNRIGTTDGLLNYVTLEQVINNYPYEDRAALPIGIGVGEGRVISWIHLSKHPHFLIGGSTGGGKSNTINVIICTLIRNHPPDDVLLVLIDLKEGLEFNHFERIPHLLMPVVKDIEDAASVLNRLEALRNERAAHLAKGGVKDIDQYNAAARSRGLKPMARIVVVFDEYAAIQIRRDLESMIQQSTMQLLNKGRAAGIHMILCTQNPSVDIIPGPSKANMAFRIAGAMPTKSASMTILGTGDAAELPDIKGRMIAMVGAKRWHIQTPHVRPKDLEDAIEAAMSYSPASVELPEDVGSISFTEQDVIAIAVDNLGGRLSATLIFDAIKDTGVSSQFQVRELTKRIRSKTEVEHDGVIYSVVKNKNSWRLVPKDTG
jgi:hypothetical protein